MLPWKIAEFRTGVGHLNHALVGYADLLSTLASGATMTDAQLRKLADDLNSNVTNAAQAFGADVSSSNAAILSATAEAALRQYIEHKRKADLLSALDQNQSVIQDASDLGRRAARITAATIRQEYNEESTSLAAKIARGAGDVRPLLELDELYIDNLRALRSIDNAYQQVPIAHQQLATTLTSEGSTFDQIQTFYKEARRVQLLYEDLKDSSESEAPKPAEHK